MSHVQENIVAFHSTLNEFRKNEKHCDVTIHVDGKTFKCHRLALSIAGEYFEKMLYGNFRENEEGVVLLQNVNVVAFEEIIRFVYTGDVLLTEDNIFDVFAASEFFKLDRMQELCIRFIERKLPMSATIMYKLFVIACSSYKKSLVTILSRCIMEHFEDYYDDVEFLELAYEDLYLLVSQHWYLSPRNEYMLLDALVRWINHEAQSRRKYSEKLMHVIDFQFISASCSKLILTRSLSESGRFPDTNEVNSGVNYEKPKLGLHVYVKNPIGDCHIFSINRCTSKWKKYYAGKLFFKHLKGIGVGDYLYCFNSSSTFHAYSSLDDTKFRSLKSPPLATREVVSPVDLCTIKNCIYLYSPGNRALPGNSNIWSNPAKNLCSKNGICCYHIEKDEWFPLPLPYAEYDDLSTMVACDKILYFFNPKRGSVQMLDDRTSSKWQKLNTTHKSSICYNCCSHNGKIYANSGGGIECFDPRAQNWYNLESTSKINFVYHLVSYEHLLWAVGSQDGSNEPFAVELYNTSVREWNQLPMSVPADIIRLNGTEHLQDFLVFKP